MAKDSQCAGPTIIQPYIQGSIPPPSQEEYRQPYDFLWGKDSTLRNHIYSYPKDRHFQDDGGISNVCMLSLEVEEATMFEETGGQSPQLHGAQLPCELRQLLIRNSYKDALQMMDDFEASRKPDTVVKKCNEDGTPSFVHKMVKGSRNRLNKGFIFLDHPGIGKTCFLSHVLVERLLKARPLFDKSGVRSVSHDDASRYDSGIWALTDQKPPGVAANFDLHSWLVVVTSSPRLENYKKIEKHYSTPVYYMPEWTWEEAAVVSSVLSSYSCVCAQRR